MNLYNNFKSVAIKYPNMKCVTDEYTSLTYLELLKEVDKTIKTLKNANTCAIIYLPKSYKIIMWQLAMNSKGIAFVTLEYGEESRLNLAIEKCKPSFIVKPEGIINFSDFQYYSCSHIIFSSGSTGVPKKILLNDKPVINVVKQQAKLTQMDVSKVFLWLLNPAFDASLSDIYMTILSGGHLIITSYKPSNLKSSVKLINFYSVTHTDIPPAVFHLWSNLKVPSLQHIIFGGELADKFWCSQLLNSFNLYNAYGPTETTICSSMCKIDENWIPEDIGLPLKNVMYKIVDGELHIGGNHCAIGYDDEQLDKKFYKNNEKWFISGDLVEFKDDRFFYRGRKDRQFKHNGQLVCPEEIETAAKNCGATFARVSYNGKILLKFSGDLNKKRLSEFIPNYMLPNHFEESEITLNNNWKTI